MKIKVQILEVKTSIAISIAPCCKISVNWTKHMWAGCGAGVEGSQMTAISVKIFSACLAHFKLHFCPLMAEDPIWWRMSGIWGEMLRWLWRNTCNSKWWGTLSKYLWYLSNWSKQIPWFECLSCPIQNSIGIFSLALHCLECSPSRLKKKSKYCEYWNSPTTHYAITQIIIQNTKYRKSKNKLSFASIKLD